MWARGQCVMKKVLCGVQEVLFFLMVLSYSLNFKRSLKCCEKIVTCPKYGTKYGTRF